MELTLGIAGRSLALRIAALSYYTTFGNIGDVVILVFWLFWRRASHILRFCENVNKAFVLGIILTATASFGVIAYTTKYPSQRRQSSLWAGPGKPLFFPSRTTHTRLLPKKHSFSYSYLLVGIPVGWSGIVGDMISVDTPAGERQGWYHVDAADYLRRGDGHLGLRGKLDQYLKSQGFDASVYPYAYMVTAAKFLGYHFNPISFWYLYGIEKQLKAMLLEVNNTFDERRMYFVTYDDNNVDCSLLDSNDEGKTAGESRRASKSVSRPLKYTWQKDLHVSPFNSRKGTYSIMAYDPLAPQMEGRGPVQNGINLSSSKDHVKLVTRIFSEGEAIDPMELTLTQKVVFISRWWWVGFVTFPRVLKEAASLFLQRGLHVWYRPEPLKESIGRHADKTERQLESIFRRYLKFLVRESSSALMVKYVPSGITDIQSEDMSSLSAEKDCSIAELLEIRVLTPAFYSRFVFYAHDLEAMFCELHENRTIWVSNPKLLPKLVFKKPAPPLHTTGYLEYAYFTAIKSLRRRPGRIQRPLTSTQTPDASRTQKDIRLFRLSSMDAYVLANEKNQVQLLYRQLVLKLFVADRIAFGSVDVLSIESYILRILLAWAVLP